MAEASQRLRYTTFTRFSIPEALAETESIEVGADLAERVGSAILPLRNVPGHHRSSWGPVTSSSSRPRHPRAALLMTVWDTREAQVTFAASQASRDLISALSALAPPSSPPPSAAAGGEFGPSLSDRTPLTGHTQLRRVFFPPAMEPAARAAVAGLEALRYPYAIGISGETARQYMAYLMEPLAGWLDGSMTWPPGTASDNGVRCGQVHCDVFMYVVLWKGPHEEARFVERVKRQRPRSAVPPNVWIPEDVISVKELWEEQLKESGAVGWEDEYVAFLPNVRI
ncbi:hypothetical protein MFIFM68171_06618 [Madurella fahalii]|uniref:Uncharacterized protein n=1 Tax=Madurella fahalii TaxID=1157608 RepID=A0ABQ0GF67_9PEZI